MTNKGNIARWANPEATKKSLLNGRIESYKRTRELTGCSFDPLRIKNISISKYSKHQNKLALYLIENEINLNKMKRLISKLNKPLHYKIERYFDEAVVNVVRLANEQKDGVLTINKAKKLIQTGVASKPKRTLSKEEQIRTWKRESVCLLTAMNPEELKRALMMLQDLQKMNLQNNGNNQL